MGNKKRKLMRKAAAAKLRKTHGVPPVILAVADPVKAFTEIVPVDPASPYSVQRCLTRVAKDVSKHRPLKGPLKKVRLRPKKVLLQRLTMRRDEDGQVVMEAIPGDPIATLDGKPYRPPKPEEPKEESKE